MSSLRLIFAGTPAFAAVALDALLASRHEVCAVYTQPDRPAGRGRRLVASPVKQLAEAHAVPVRQPPTLREAETQQALAALNADAMIVAAYGLLLPEPVLEAPRLGCLNIHASLLPRWRGAAPIQRAMLAGDAETGITIMQMDAGLDTGAMLRRVATPIDPRETAGELHDRLAPLGAAALLEVLEALAAGPLHGEPQDERLATYAPKLDKGEARLDWQASAEHLARAVRAYNPWPMAHTTLDGAPLRVLRAEAVGGGAEGRPGEILRTGEAGIEVATGAGVLRLLEVQPAGKRPMSAAALAHGRSLHGRLLGQDAR
ncbi:methionyl-tRNA formyltransferase [Ectothiorhodospiraceae bacterium 2226]|nr:methionyl-tRNA formyltransferase [Ectothiorhodospiraceae bacterium 2226]